MQRSLLKHLQLRETLRGAIAAGQYAAGARLPSEHDLVRLYGVSRPTVREAVGSLVQEGLLERLRGSGTFVTQAPGDPREIMFVLFGRDYTDPLFARTLKGAEQQCGRLGYRLGFCHAAGLADLPAVEQRLANHPAKGIVVTGILELRWLLRLLDLNANTVLVGDVVGRRRTPDVVLRIVSNNGEAAGEAMDHLLGLGHRRIAHITGDLNRVWFREPYDAYAQRLRDAGLPLDKGLVIACADEGLDHGHAAASALLQLPLRPTAIFASNDRFAWGAIRAIREAQLRCPQDISVIGMNDLPLGDHRDFLTTMAIDQERTGILAVDRVVAGASGQTEELIVPMTLLVRESCSALPLCRMPAPARRLPAAPAVRHTRQPENAARRRQPLAASEGRPG